MTYYAILRVMTIWQSDKILKEKTGEEDKAHRGRVELKHQGRRGAWKSLFLCEVELRLRFTCISVTSDFKNLEIPSHSSYEINFVS